MSPRFLPVPHDAQSEPFHPQRCAVTEEKVQALNLGLQATKITSGYIL